MAHKPTLAIEGAGSRESQRRNEQHDRSTTQEDAPGEQEDPLFQVFVEADQAASGGQEPSMSLNVTRNETPTMGLKEIKEMELTKTSLTMSNEETLDRR